MRIVCLLCLILTLAGCAAPVWETVEDFVPAEPAGLWQEDAYCIEIGVPEGIALTEQSPTGCLYEGEQMTVETMTFLSSDYHGAVEQISGFSSDRLHILQTDRFGMPEYQFAWVSQAEEGARLHRADLVMDGTVCYAVVCTVPEGTAAMEEVSAVFSTFGLSDRT